jgi:alkylation response protein AidB-like acyl-CoA dehydrogenase
MLTRDNVDGNVQLRTALRTANLGDSPDRIQLRALARDYLTNTRPADVAGMIAGTGHDEWRRLADQQGWQALAIPESHGGAGYGFAELAVVIEECGRLLAFPAMLTTVVLAATLLNGCDEASRAELLPRIASGDVLLAVVGDLYGDASTDVSAVLRAGNEWQLSGNAAFVLDGLAADVYLVRAHTPDGPALFSCDAGQSAITRQPMTTLDPTRPQASVTLTEVSARLVCPAQRFDRVWNRARDLTAVALAAEQLGGATRLLEVAVDYAGLREQFGRPIGSFQAIKHKCADLLVDVEAARSATEFAIWAAAQDHESLPLASAIAQAATSETYSRVAAENIQIHGGIGFTWEHPAHLYLRRAKSDEALLGDPYQQRSRIGALLQLSEPPR